MALHFERAEFDARVAAARAALRREGLAAILLFAQESHFYLTGFDTSGFVFFQCAVLGADDGPVTLLTRRPDLEQARRTSTIEDIRLWYDAEGADPSRELLAILEERGLRGARVGIELRSFGLTADKYELVRRRLEGWCELVDASAIVRELMEASGAGGMIGGQLLDLEAEGEHVGVASLERVHRLKTGALITASVSLGARAALAPEPRRLALARYGEAIGLAFQIADDVLDITATTDQLGKTAGRDLALHKSTYPALLGIEGATARASALVDEACDALSGEGLLTPALEQLARYIVTRRS